MAGGAGAALWTFGYDAENDRQPRNVEVDRAVARIYMARARAEATEANRDGRYDHAQRVVEETARRIRTYAGTDAELQHLAQALGESVAEYGRQMGVMSAKASYFCGGVAVEGAGQLRSGAEGAVIDPIVRQRQ